MPFQSLSDRGESSGPWRWLSGLGILYEALLVVESSLGVFRSTSLGKVARLGEVFQRLLVDGWFSVLGACGGCFLGCVLWGFWKVLSAWKG